MRGRLVAREELSSSIRDQLFRLLDGCFEGVSRDRFAADLDGKDWVILLEDARRGIVGFSTFAMSATPFGNRRLSVVFSGDTIVEPGSWGSPALPATWIAAVLSLHAGSGNDQLFWLLITSGFRTYRFLPVMAREFFPSCERPASASLQMLRHHLAQERFGDAYDPTSGVVRFVQPQVLRAELAGIPAARLDDPHVAFFARSNPGHEQGDELVCLTEVSEENLTAAGRRMLRLGRRLAAPVIEAAAS